MKISIPAFIVVTAVFSSGMVSCKKNSSADNNQPPDDDTTTVITPPNDPSLASTIGFFGDEWSAKTFVTPSSNMTAKPTATPDVTVEVDMSHVLTKVSHYLFGNNSTLWMTQIVDQSSLVNYIKDLSPHIIRAPAGSVSDVYFFNAQPNQKPADVPDSLYDTNGNKVPTSYWYGKNTESWTLSIDNYYQLLAQTNSTGLITVNYGYARYGTSANPVAAAAHLAADWVRYDNGRTKFWEIGNESNGVWEASYKIDLLKNKDGQPELITGDLYGSHFKIFADSMRAAALASGKTIYIGAQLLDAEPASWQTNTDKTWNQGVLEQAGTVADFYIIHDYFTPYQANSTGAEILATGNSIPLQAMTYIKQQLAAYGAPVRPLALTEWNIQAQGSKQNVSNVAGLHAVITLGELIKNEFGQASRWDLANGWDNGNDHGMFNNGTEPGAVNWNPRPAFYYMYFFQKCFGDKMVSSAITGDNAVLSYASSYSSGESSLVVVNTGMASRTVEIKMKNFKRGTNYYWYTLSGGNDNGEFSGAVKVNGASPSGPTGGPPGYAAIKASTAYTSGGIYITAPARSAVFISIENKK